MKLQTPVIDESCKVAISLSDKIMMLGSCFSDNIGKALADYGFNVYINPFGTLYNPASIARSVQRLIVPSPFTLEDCTVIGAGNLKICSFSHHTSFAGDTPEDFLKKANNSLIEASEFFRKSTKIIITLGTSWCFRHNGTKQIVNNCLKHPASEFSRELMSTDQIKAQLNDIIDLCNKESNRNPEFARKEFIFTVSPIRHFKDGAHGNQISKSSLLIGIDAIIRNPHTDYFPAYEIMMDELRDYRFYAEDMCHPSDQAVHYIRDRFLNWAVPENEKTALQENIRKFKQSCHISR